MDIVVDSRWVQGFPPLMPRQVEKQLTPEELLAVRDAARKGALYVRLDSPEGERFAVVDMMFNPHDQYRITFVLLER